MPNSYPIFGPERRRQPPGIKIVPQVGDGQPDPIAETTPEFDPGEHTIAEVRQYVEDYPSLWGDVLAAERAGKNRVTLVEWLAEEQED
jgi:hypothetical protein